MEGRGVVNYHGNRPSYAISTETTEFDDALIRRGIISFEESMMRKGASHQEALRLKEMKEHGTLRTSTTGSSETTEATATTEETCFLEQHRKKRLQELKQKGGGGCGRFGHVVIISRQDWARDVNEASQRTWVVVSLTSSDVERTGCMEQAVTTLSGKYHEIKFVAIPHQQAIENWPEEHLPTVFLYRYGKMQHQLVSLPTSLSPDQLEWKLAQLGVLETDLDEEPKGHDRTSIRFKAGSYRGTVFGGTGSELKTRELVNTLNDYDDVD